MTEARMQKANLFAAKMFYANLQNSVLREVVFMNANLYAATLQGANVRGSDFTNAKLYRANLQNAVLRKSLFEKAELKRTVFRGCDLSHAKFTESDLTKAICDGACMYGTILETSCNIQDSSFRGVQSTDDYEDTIKRAYLNNKELVSDVSGIRILKSGNEFIRASFITDSGAID